VSSYQQVALELILGEPQLSPALELFPSPRMSTLDTLRLFVSSAKMRLEVQSNMTTGRSSRPEIVEQLWLDRISQNHMLIFPLNITQVTTKMVKSMRNLKTVPPGLMAATPVWLEMGKLVDALK
jgi:hypothetical protein